MVKFFEKNTKKIFMGVTIFLCGLLVCDINVYANFQGYISFPNNATTKIIDGNTYYTDPSYIYLSAAANGSDYYCKAQAECKNLGTGTYQYFTIYNGSTVKKRIDGFERGCDNSYAKKAKTLISLSKSDYSKKLTSGKWKCTVKVWSYIDHMWNNEQSKNIYISNTNTQTCSAYNSFETTCKNTTGCAYSNGKCLEIKKLDSSSCVSNNLFWDGSTCKKEKTSCIAGYKIDSNNSNKCIKEETNVRVETNKGTTYSISFNQNGGYGLECNDSSWSVPSPGICKKTGISSGTSIAIPKTSSTMYDINNPSFKLIGWTKTNCNSGNIIKNSSVKVTNSSEYKACYREDIGGNRYLQNGFIADGEPSKFKCGDSAFIEYCTKESNGEYCYMFEGGKYRKIYRDKLAENTNSGKAAALASCGTSTTSNDQKNINKYMYALTNGSDFKCGEALYVTTCVGNTCTFNKISKFDKSVVDVDNKTINYDDLTSNSNDAKNTCEKINIDEDDNGCNNQTDSDNKGKGSYTVCYPYGSSKDKIIDEIKSYYNCVDDYIIDESSIYSEDEEESCNDKNTVCSRTYNVTCVRSEGKYKPTVEVKSGNVGSDGTGNITVYANSKEGRIVQYYASPIYKAPTETTLEWVDVNSDTFTINSTPGVMYIWVKDINGNVSHGIGGAVFDTINLNTTVDDMKFKDSNGGILSPTGNTAYKLEGITDSSYVRLSNSLVNESVIAENGFNPFTMEYKLEVDTPTISVYATLTSTDSNYVNGYEPRTVNLDYGMNTILIKIQNKEGKVRTYTILVNRVDSRTADNTLSDLSIDVGKIDFNTNKTEYKIEIPTDTEKVNVNATIGDDKASFVDGYKPGIVNINGDTTVSFIKVKSETGSTRTYVLTFIKEGTDEIKKKNLMLSDLVIPGVYVAFEEEIVNYNISVAYETELINLNYDLKDKDSSATVYFKGKNDSEYRISSNQGIKLDVGENFVEIKIINEDGEESYYRLTIIRKEFGLGISNDTTLKDLSVLGYDINYESNKKEYVVKIKQEKSLVITAIPNNNRAEVFIRGNDELTGFSTVRVKVVAENGEFDTYSIDIKKDAFNKTIEIAAIIAGVVIILGSSCIIVIKNKNKKKKEYYEE